jgi:Holliday junction DNA helicase RuvA
MISRIKGKIKDITELSILLETGNLTYEILIPSAVMNSIGNNNGENIELITYHYYQTDPSKSVPVLIGFLNQIEKEFFERFISVSGVGPKAACKALTLPFSTIADGIDSADITLLKSLPGIGEQKAKEIIAKLQGKVGKFGLIQDRGVTKVRKVKEDIITDAMSVLLQLQYKKKEAEHMLEKAIGRNPDMKTSEELLNEVYRQKTRK